MAKLPVQLLLILLILPAVAGLNFNVDVSTITDHSVKDLEYSDSVPQMQDINATVTNIGSIGCTYRMRASFQQGNKSFERFSSPEALWQGDYERMEINYIPTNYTGSIQTKLSLQYCGQEKQLESFSFNVTENTTINSTVDSRTISSSDETTEIEVEGDKLVPQEEPAYWKTSSAEIVNGTAEVEYDAPIFDRQEEITYTVIEDGEIQGSTEVTFEPEPTLKEKIMDRKLEILTSVLGVSVLANILLVLKDRGVLHRIREIDYELPEFKKD